MKKIATTLLVLVLLIVALPVSKLDVYAAKSYTITVDDMEQKFTVSKNPSSDMGIYLKMGWVGYKDASDQGKMIPRKLSGSDVVWEYSVKIGDGKKKLYGAETFIPASEITGDVVVKATEISGPNEKKIKIKGADFDTTFFYGGSVGNTKTELYGQYESNGDGTYNVSVLTFYKGKRAGTSPLGRAVATNVEKMPTGIKVGSKTYKFYEKIPVKKDTKAIKVLF